MKFPEIKRANIHKDPVKDEEWAYDDTITEERKSRAAWARALAEHLSEAGRILVEKHGVPVGDLITVYVELLRQAVADEKGVE